MNKEKKSKTRLVATTKRLDNKGRRLRLNESQLKSGKYRFNYTNALGVRTCKESWRLLETDPLPIGCHPCDSLREIEAEIMKDTILGKVGYNYTVRQVVESYLNMRHYRKHNTKQTYYSVFNGVQNEPFLEKNASEIKIFDAKLWFKQMAKAGRSKVSLKLLQVVFKNAFAELYESCIILQNPFDFRVGDAIVESKEPKRITLTSEQRESYLNYLLNHEVYSEYYDDMVVLLESGLRASEYCGLTVEDIDFNEGIIDVNKQLLINNDTREFYVDTTKTKSSTRKVYILSRREQESLMRLVEKAKRRYREPIVDGVTHFLILTRSDNPMSDVTLNQRIKSTIRDYNKTHKDQLPDFTAHSCRHTYATELINENVRVETVQHQLGHSTYQTTMNVYVAKQEHHDKQELEKIMRF